MTNQAVISRILAQYPTIIETTPSPQDVIAAGAVARRLVDAGEPGIVDSYGRVMPDAGCMTTEKLAEKHRLREAALILALYMRGCRFRRNGQYKYYPCLSPLANHVESV